METVLETVFETVFESNPEIKTCFIHPSTKDQKIIQKKEKKKRKITTQPKWIQVSPEKQRDFIQQDNVAEKVLSPVLETLFIQQIRQKLSGYKSQDIKKKRYSPELFIQKEDLLELLKKSGLICLYCHEPISLLYEHVREPKQWSLDRIDNSLGHNTDNVCIACLACNLRRKTIHYERYVRAKQQQLFFVKVIDKEPEPEPEPET